MVALFMMMSLLLAAYGPMTTYSQAQSANDAALSKLKSMLIAEMQRKIAFYEKTIQNLSVDSHVDGAVTDAHSPKRDRNSRSNSTTNIPKPGTSTNNSASPSVTPSPTPSISPSATPSPSPDSATVSNCYSGDGKSAGAKVSVVGPNGSCLSFVVDSTGIHGDIFISSVIKDKVQKFIQKIVDSLKSMIEKVMNSKILSQLRDFATNFYNQYIVGTVTNVQAAITQAVDSVTGVLDNLKTTYNNLQERVGQLNRCAAGLKSGETSVDVSIGKSESSLSCGDFKVTSQDVSKAVQPLLDNVKNIISTIGSVVGSIVTLLMSLISQFASMLGSSLGNLGSSSANLSSLLSGGSISSLLSSFQGVASQLDMANSMSSGAQGLLSNIADSL